MSPCPSPQQLRLLLSDELGGPELASAESHVEDCPSCQATLESLVDAEAADAGPLSANGRPRGRAGEGADVLVALKAILPMEMRPLLDPEADTRLSLSWAGSPSPRGEDGLPRVAGYVVLDELGRGGMSVVYRARQVALNRPVALKMILSGGHATAGERDRFHREAEAVAQLQHPHIVQIYEVGEHDRQPYLALEFVDGGSLAHRLRGQPQPTRRAAELVETLARAVHAAHQHGIVHRDLKPANILLTTEGVPKVADFGLAKTLGADSSLTHTGQLLGTPSYMAPEQASSAGGDHAASGGTAPGAAADIYSLGAILYEMLTGRPPFRAQTSLETVLQVLHDDPVPPSRLQPKLPRDLETICLTCLHKEPSRRYPDAPSLADDLRRFLDGEPVQARPISAGERLWKWARRRPAAAGLAVGGVLALALGFAGVALLWRMAEARATLETRAHREASARADLERKAKEAEANALREAERQNVGLLVDRNLALCERGMVNQGMLGLADALARGPSGADDLHRVIRANLAAWRYRLVNHRHSLEHDGRVHAVAYRPDGRVALTGGADDAARLWDLDTGKPLGLPLRHLGAVVAVAFSPDGRVALTGSADGTARLWDAATGEPSGPPLAHQGEVRVVAFSPDGRVALTASADHTARLWDVTTGRPVGEPMRHSGEVLAAAFGTDGRAVLTGSQDRTARLWDAATGGPLGAPWGHEDAVQAVAFSPDGRRAATASRDGTVRLWDPADGRPRHPPLRHTFPVCALAFSPDGAHLLTGSGLTNPSKGEARVWDAATGQPSGVVMPHNGQVGCVAWSPNGRHVLTGGEERRACLWLAAVDWPIRRPLAQGGMVQAVAFGPDGRTLLIASYDTLNQPSWGEARLHDAPPEQQVGPSLPQPGRVAAVAISPDGRTVVTAGADDARLWDAATGRLLGDPLPTHGPVHTVAISPDGRAVVTGGPDGVARLWDVATGRPLGDPLAHPGLVRASAFSPDGRTLATAGDFPEATLWDVATGRRRGVAPPHRDLLAVAFSPDGRAILTGGRDSTARLWDAATGRPLGEPLQHRRPVRSVAISPDGRTVLTGSADMTAQLWDAATGRPAAVTLLHRDALTKVAFSPDGRTLATVCEDGSARLWDAATGKPIGAPLPHDVVTLAFHPDGQTLLTGGREGTARSWTVPLPLRGDAEQVLLWTEIVTGTEADAHGVLHRLDAEAVQQLRRRWEQLGAMPPL
jgi:eukaryotic-like serine/threonine-protein kinase